MIDAARELLDNAVTEITRLQRLELALAAFIEQPDQGEAIPPSRPDPVQTSSEADEGASAPEGEAASARVVASPKHRKETFVCSRCPMTFKTKGWRDRHEAKHPPIARVESQAGERIRRAPPALGYEPSEPASLVNGSPGMGQ